MVPIPADGSRDRDQPDDLCRGAVCLGRCREETSGAYASTEPASATFLLDEAIGADQMAMIAAEVADQPGVLEATGRAQFTSEVEVDGHELEIPLQVFVAAPDDPMRMVTFFLEERSWPPSAGEILIGGDSMLLLGVSLGDTITIQAPSGEPMRLRVADSVYDPSLSPAPQEQTGRAYLSAEALTISDGPARLDQLKIQVADPGEATPSRDRDAIVAVANDVGAWLESERGLTIREIQIPKPYAHPHQWQADALLLSSSPAVRQPWCSARCWSRTCSTIFSPSRSRRSGS